MQSVLSKNQKGAKPAQPSRAAASGDVQTSAEAQRMPAYASGRGPAFGVTSAPAKAIQTKLAVGQPDDPFEKEAEAVAEHVMMSPANAPPADITKRAGVPPGTTLPGDDHEPTATAQRQPEEEEEDDGAPDDEVAHSADEEVQLQRKCDKCEGELVQHKCAECEREELQRQPAAGAEGWRGHGLTAETEARVNTLRRGGGATLPAPVRGFYESRLGHDFSSVRVHTGADAARAARSLGARAYTIGHDIAFGAGEYAPASDEGQRLLAHELTHVVQQGGSAPTAGGESGPTGGGASKPTGTGGVAPMLAGSGRAARPQAKASAHVMVQRQGGPLPVAEYTELEVAFKDGFLLYQLELEDATAEALAADPELSQAVSDHIAQIFMTPEGKPVYETPEFLQSNRVKNLIERDLENWALSGVFRVLTMSRLSAFIAARTRALIANKLLHGVIKYLDDSSWIDPATIDWNVVIPQLQERLPKDAKTAVEASDFDRYAMVLDILRHEASGNEPVVGAVQPDLESLEDILLYEYTLDVLPAEAFTEETRKLHSEKFLRQWLTLIEQIKYVPDGFDITQYSSKTTEQEINQLREAALTEFMQDEAKSLAFMFVLDEWERADMPADEWLAGLDLAAYKEGLVEHLTDKLMLKLKGDERFVPSLEAVGMVPEGIETMTSGPLGKVTPLGMTGAMIAPAVTIQTVAPNMVKVPADKRFALAVRVAAVEQARYQNLTSIYFRAWHQDNFLRALPQALTQTPLAELSEGQRAVAEDPQGFWHTSNQFAYVTREFLSKATLGADFTAQMMEWALGYLSAIEAPPLLALLFPLDLFQKTIEERKKLFTQQEGQARAAIRELVEVNYEEIARVIEQRAEIARAFIEKVWKPMLKRITLERLAANRAASKELYETMDESYETQALRLEEGASAFEKIADEFAEGLHESIEMDGKVLTLDGVGYLRDAAQFMLGGVAMFRNPKRMSKEKAKVKEALDLYETVMEDVENDKYDPLNYAEPVFEEARARLGIGEFRPGTTYYMLFKGWEDASVNPFLAMTIAEWKFWGRQIKFSTILLGIVQMALLLIPGIGWLIDLGISIALGVKDIMDAKRTLNMAKVDTYGDIVGISVEDAEKAYKHAWIGLGVSVVLFGGPAALRRGMKFRPGAAGKVDVSEYARWEKTLSRETQQALKTDAKLARTFREMPTDVRRLLTHCSFRCIPSNITAAQTKEIKALLSRHGLSGDHAGLRKYFRLPENRANMTKAINDLKRFKTAEGLQEFVKLARFPLLKPARIKHLSRPGYSNYVLREGGPQGRIYYSGMMGPEETVAGLKYRHATKHKNRFNEANGDYLDIQPGTRNYGDSRLMEQRLAVKNKTIIGKKGNDYRGNRQNPLGDDKMPEYLEYEKYKQSPD